MARILFGKDVPRGALRRAEPDQRELTARVGLLDARRRARVRRGEPGGDHDAVHPGRAMSPATAAGAATQTLAEAMAGMAYVQLVRPGAPVVFGSFASSMSMQSGAPTFGTPEPALVLYALAACARRLGVPFRSGGSLTASKIADAQAAYESANTLQPTILGGVNFVLHAAGWLEGGLTMGYEKFVMDLDQCGMMRGLRQGRGPVAERTGVGGDRRERPGPALPGHGAHAGQLRVGLLPQSIADNNSFEQWEIDGSRTRLPGRTRSGRRCSPSTRRRRSTRRRTRSSGVDRAQEGILPRLERIGRERHGGAETTEPRRALTQDQQAALRRLVAAPKFELIPLSDAAEKADAVCRTPSTVTVTASPSHGYRSHPRPRRGGGARGHAAIPHLSAHMIRDRAHLGEVLDRCRAGAASAGRSSSVATPRTQGRVPRRLDAAPGDRRAGHPFTEIGVPSYPEGHVDIADDVLSRRCVEKQRYATYMTTQMCFNPGAIVSWIAQDAAAGVTLPVHLGTPGVAELTKLMTISARIGIADIGPLPEEEQAMVGHLLTARQLRARRVAGGHRAGPHRSGRQARGLHLFTFNQVQATVDWQQRMLAAFSTKPEIRSSPRRTSSTR